MCHLGNTNHPSADATGRKVNYSAKKEEVYFEKRNKFLDRIFKFCGRSSNNFLMAFYLLFNVFQI